MRLAQRPVPPNSMDDDRVTALTRLSSEQRQRLRNEVQRIEETAGKKQAILFLMLALTKSVVVSTLVDDEMLLQLVEEQGCGVIVRAE